MEHETVFIVGLPRTGSTLLRTQLNRSDRVCITAETHFIPKWSRIGRKKWMARFGDLRDDQNLDRLLDEFYSPKFQGNTDFWAWLNRNVPRDVFRRRIYPTDRSDRAFFDLLMRIYPEVMKGWVTKNLVLGEKTSANIYYLPTLFEWYPNSKVIHTFRDPRGIFVSASKLVRAGRWGVKSKLPPLPKPLVNPVLEVIMATYISRTWNDASRLHPIYEKQYPDRYMLVKFEDMIVDPQYHISRICDFINVPFENQMIEDVAVIGSSYNAQRIVPLGFDTVVADRWKEHIHPWTRAWFSQIGKRQLESFGYLP